MRPSIHCLKSWEGLCGSEFGQDETDVMSNPWEMYDITPVACGTKARGEVTKMENNAQPRILKKEGHSIRFGARGFDET
jgi:hypothetical protein